MNRDLHVCHNPRMQIHDELPVGFPEFLTVEDLTNFLKHVDSCKTCMQLVDEFLEFDLRLVEPLRREWCHLSRKTLETLARSKFTPDVSPSSTLEKFHVTVCPLCRDEYSKLMC